MLKFRRDYSIASLIVLLVAVVLLVALYRGVAIRSIVHLGEEKNIHLAKTALNSIHNELIDFLARSRDSKPRADSPHVRTMAKELETLMSGTTVARIKILDSRGIVVFSSRADQIGNNENDNPRYEKAIVGQVSSSLIYRDRFNPFDETTGDENLIQTYLPIREDDEKPIRGVFEVYTDVTKLVEEVERTEGSMIIGAVLILGMVYFALLLVVERVGRVMQEQRQTIFERTRALELVSAQLMNAQEIERKRLAEGLHEGLAQSLAGIKLKLDAARSGMSGRYAGEAMRTLSSAADSLGAAIEETRTLAMKLRPPSLDDLGLVDTLAWYVKQLHQTHPSVTVTSSIDIDEADIPAHLKISVFRVAEEVLESLASQSHTSGVSVGLERSKQLLSLIIADAGESYRPGSNPPRRENAAIAAARERALLSGGTFGVETTPWGALQIRASWPLLEISVQSPPKRAQI